jgi:small GTP-binding protein
MRTRSYSVSDVNNNNNATAAVSADQTLIKLLMLGDSGVGKSSLLRRYVDDTFSPTFSTTIGIDFKIKTLTVNNKNIKLQIWDTAGQERFRTITTAYYRGAHGVIIVFDVTSKTTYTNAYNTWLPSVRKLSENNNPVIVLAGNKCDQDGLRVVTAREAGELVKAHQLAAYTEVSASSRHNVDALFYDLLTRILDESSAASASVEKEGFVSVMTNDDDGNKNKGCC